ncbi:metal-dependent hydrolase [Nocardia sp. NPDC055165]
MSTLRDQDKVALKARAVEWDWTGLPFHYVYDDPFSTHVINSFNMLLPEGEVFFVQVFQQALPLITDPEVHEDVVGFIGQEATHSSAHQSLVDYLDLHGLDSTRFTDQIRWFFRALLGERELTDRRAHNWLLERVAVVAALEHFTSYLGDWALNADAWRRGTIETRVLDLVLWHLAEEVEHRHVAYDLFTHLDGSYWHRIRAYLVAMPTFALLHLRGMRLLLNDDPVAERGLFATVRAARRAWRAGMVPSPGSLAKMSIEYFRPSYHPRKYGSTSQAVAYLAASPAALAAS